MERPLQNRVLPTGEIQADPARGTFMGNRGILHGPDRRLGVSRWKHHNWVCCALSFKGRQREVMRPGSHYTELFFFDEAVALAAGHRPCGECRRADYTRWQRAWAAAFGEVPSAPQMDRQLHRDRVRRDRSQIRHTAPADDLPTGAFALLEGKAHVIAEGRALPFAPTGYGPPRTLLPGAFVTVLTPRTTVDVLRAGYAPDLHGTATAAAL